MKKYGKFFKKAALTAAICLSLSQSVWAMPTGGAVETGADLGTVKLNGANFTNGDVTGVEATIASVGGPAVINWQAFGIASGETLNFNTAEGALLNRVEGINGVIPMSEIYGTLNQTGGNPMFLVNPAGILVGSTGVINGSDIALSTLAVSNDQFRNMMSGMDIAEFGGNSNPGPLTIEKGATIQALRTEKEGNLALLGGTITVADGVTFSVDDTLVMTAANSVTAMIGETGEKADYTIGSGHGEAGSGAFVPLDISATSKNLLSVGNKELKSSKLAFLAGGKVDITGTTIESEDVNVLAASSGHTVHSTRVPSGADIVFEAGADNAITINGATLKASGDIDVIGGKVNIEGGSKLEMTKGDGDLDICALGRYTAFADGDASNQALSADHTLTLKDSVVSLTGKDPQEDHYIYVGAGKVTLDNTIMNSDTGIAIAAYNTSADDTQNYVGTAGKDNTLTIANGSVVHADEWMMLLSGSADISNSMISAGQGIHLLAMTTATMNPSASGIADAGSFESATATPENTVKLNKATINAVAPNNDNYAPQVAIFGGKVDITNGSAITETNVWEKKDLQIHAVPGGKWVYDNSGDEEFIVDASKATSGDVSDYAVTIKDSTVTLETSGSKGDPSISLGGGKVTLDGSTVKLTGGNDNGINIYAVGGQESDSMMVTAENGGAMIATAENLVEITNGSKIDSKGQRVEIVAGQIAVTGGSEISGKNTLLVANDKIGFKTVEALKNTMPYGMGTKGNIAVSADSKIPTDATIDGNRTEAPVVNPVDPVNPVKPDPAPANLEESRKAGEARMEEAFSKSTDVASLVNNTQTAVKDITDSSDSYAGQLEQFKGVLSVIANQEGLSNAQKTALQNEAIKEFVSDYVPAKQAQAGADNTVTSATNNVGDNAQPQQNQQAGAAGTGNVSVPTAGEANESPVSGVQEG